MAREKFLAYGMMWNAVDQGIGFQKLYNDAKGKGLTYNRNDMAADFREVKAEYENAQQLRSVQAGEIPPHVEVSTRRIAYTEAFIYKAKVGTQLSFGGPITEKFVTVLSKAALTLQQVAEQISQKWGGWEYAKAERVVNIQPLVALHQVD
jgi:hypothetical protein